MRYKYSHNIIKEMAKLGGGEKALYFILDEIQKDKFG